MDKDAGHIKVAALKRFDTEDVFKDPPVKAEYSGPCPIFGEGQVFYVDGSVPNGFCPYAWDAIFLAVITLKSNGNFIE